MSCCYLNILNCLNTLCSPNYLISLVRDFQDKLTSSFSVRWNLLPIPISWQCLLKSRYFSEISIKSSRPLSYHKIIIQLLNKYKAKATNITFKMREPNYSTLIMWVTYSVALVSRSGFAKIIFINLIVTEGYWNEIEKERSFCWIFQQSIKLHKWANILWNN